MEYKMKSPLIPQEGGYPIILGQGIEAEDLEVEYIPIVRGGKQALLPVLNPFLMKGATKYLRAKNANSEAELDEMAEQLVSGK